MPHCTVAFDVPLPLIPQAIEVCQGKPLPIRGQVQRAALVEMPVRKEYFAFALGEG